MAEEIRNRVLIIEDEKELRLTIRGLLEADGLSCDVADDGAVGLQMAVSGDYALILLDLNLPSLRGMDICKEIRKRELPCSVLMLTARAEESDIIAGLSVGADDYVIKPFRPNELLARVRAHLRRAAATDDDRDQEPLRLGRLEIDLGARRAFLDGVEMALRPKEFDLLVLLAQNAGRVVTRERIMSIVWDTEWMGSTKTLDTHILSLRRKLAPDAIATLRGVGYRLEDT